MLSLASWRTKEMTMFDTFDSSICDQQIVDRIDVLTKFFIFSKYFGSSTNTTIEFLFSNKC